MYCEDGYYLEERASSSSVGESMAQRLFNEYKQIPIIAENEYENYASLIPFYLFC